MDRGESGNLELDASSRPFKESRLVQIQSCPLKLGDQAFNLSLADIIYDSRPKGDLPHRSSNAGLFIWTCV